MNTIKKNYKKVEVKLQNPFNFLLSNIIIIFCSMKNNKFF